MGLIAINGTGYLKMQVSCLDLLIPSTLDVPNFLSTANTVLMSLIFADIKKNPGCSSLHNLVRPCSLRLVLIIDGTDSRIAAFGIHKVRVEAQP